MAILKWVDFEAGDLSEFDSVDDSGGFLNVIPGAASPPSAFGMEVELNGASTPARRGFLNTSLAGLPAAAPFRFRVDVNPNGEKVGIGSGRLECVVVNTFEFTIAIEDGPGGVGDPDEWEIYIALSGSPEQRVAAPAGWTTVQCRVDAGADTIEVWVNKASSETPDVSISGGTVNPFTTMAAGAGNPNQFVTTPASYFIDNLVVSDDDAPLDELPRLPAGTIVGTTRPYGFAVIQGGAAATELGPCGGLSTADDLVAVLRVADPPAGFTDVTSDASVPKADRITLATTDSTGAFLLVTWNKAE